MRETLFAIVHDRFKRGKFAPKTSFQPRYWPMPFMKDKIHPRSFGLIQKVPPSPPLLLSPYGWLDVNVGSFQSSSLPTQAKTWNEDRFSFQVNIFKRTRIPEWSKNPFMSWMELALSFEERFSTTSGCVIEGIRCDQNGSIYDQAEIIVSSGFTKMLTYRRTDRSSYRDARTHLILKIIILTEQ